MDTATASQLTFNALAHAVAGEGESAATALTTLGSQADDALMYGACCGLAETGKQMLKKIYGNQAPKNDGDLWIIEQLTPDAPADPAKMFALRFVIAWANGDTDTCLALFDAALNAGGDQYVDSVAALLKTVAGITRLALDQQKEGQL